MSVNIRQYLSSLPGDETYYYLPNPGNAGDAMIAWATFKLFDELKLNYRVVDPRNFNPGNKVFIYGGGGNLVPEWRFARKIINKYYPFLKRLILLPQTIRGQEKLLNKLGHNSDIICREQVSFEYVKKTVSKPNVLLMDDMAFSLKPEELIGAGAFPFFKDILRVVFYKRKAGNSYRVFPALRKLTKNRKDVFLNRYLNRLNRQNREAVNLFRTDRERPDRKIPRNNLDISRLFKYGTENREQAYYSSRQIMNFINKYKEIRTDRLHVAIAGALLGKAVKLYSNGNYKCEAVYQYSMRDRFPNVKWMG